MLTEDFPKDHRHHRGVFWAWHYLAVGDQQIGDPWTCKDIEWDVTEVKTSPTPGGTALQLQAEVLWKSPKWTDAKGNAKPLVAETTRITVHSAAENYREIDFEISLLAKEENVRLAGAQDDKGYGGFCVRVPLPDTLRFTGKNGNLTPMRTAIPAGPWLDFSAPFTEDAPVNGVSVLQHPKNPGFPEPWILRSETSMQNAMYPGREPITLSTKEPLTLRYRLIVHRGDAREADIAKLQPGYEFKARRDR